MNDTNDSMRLHDLTLVELRVSNGENIYHTRSRAIAAAAHYGCDARFVHNGKAERVSFVTLQGCVKPEAVTA